MPSTELENAVTIGSGIKGSKLTVKKFDKLFPIVFPSQWFILFYFIFSSFIVHRGLVLGDVNCRESTVN